LITHILGEMSVGRLGSVEGWSDAAEGEEVRKVRKVRRVRRVRKVRRVKMGGSIFPVCILWLYFQI
jgi:hypothetical protein